MTVWRPPTEFNRILVPRNVLQQTLDHLDDGCECESIAYWAGEQLGRDLRVTRLVKPFAYRGERFVFVPVEEVSKTVNECASNGDFLVAQLHTHPADEDHSKVDDCGTVSKRDGFVSLVLPFYAQPSTVDEPVWFGYQLVAGIWTMFNMKKIYVTA